MNTIKVKSYSKVNEEYIAHEEITPGMLVQLRVNGKLEKHNIADGDAAIMFAFEDELQGKTIDQTYKENDPVQVWIPYRGDQVNAILASGQNVTRGMFLASAGNGKLKVVDEPGSLGVANPLQIVGVALEPVNATLADKRIQIMIV